MIAGKMSELGESSGRQRVFWSSALTSAAVIESV
jgi:hypothetical protein